MYTSFDGRWKHVGRDALTPAGPYRGLAMPSKKQLLFSPFQTLAPCLLLEPVRLLHQARPIYQDSQ